MCLPFSTLTGLLCMQCISQALSSTSYTTPRALPPLPPCSWSPAVFIVFRCVPKPQVCLTTFEKFGCSQYECVPRQLPCAQARDPVCDTDHMEHSNLCTLYQRGKSLSYRGPCQVCCLATKPKGIKLVYDLFRQAEGSPTEKGVVWRLAGRQCRL